MTLNVRQGGVWVSAIPHVRQGGVWSPCTAVYVREAGVWQQAYASNITFTSTGTRTNVNIFADFGSPTEAGDYIWINDGDCRSGTGTYAVTTGTFPAGSTLTIVNNGYIRGKGGKGGNATNTSATAGSPGQAALTLGFTCSVDNTNGYIYGGGGGGGGSRSSSKATLDYGGGGGAGSDPGNGGSAGDGNGKVGTLTSGGAGAVRSGDIAQHAGDGGGLGSAGLKGTCSLQNAAGGAAGKAITVNGYGVTILGGNNATQIKGVIA